MEMNIPDSDSQKRQYVLDRDLARSQHSVKDKVYDANGDSNPTLTQEAIFLWLPEEFGEGMFLQIRNML